nr:hypothetical protein [Tanacetum cinerariifolium]
MANLSEDIQCAGSDTRPPMLDRTNFASWQQRIRLYCQGKENEVNILKSIDEGTFQMGTFRETLVEGEEGAFHLGLERALFDSDLSPEDKDRTSSNTRNQATVQDDRVVVHNVLNRTKVKGTMQGERVQLVTGHIARNYTQPKRPQNLKYFKDKMLLMPAQENRVVSDEEQLMFIVGGQDNIVDEDMDEPPVQDLALNVANAFQADECDAFDSDDVVCEHHEVQEMHDDVQPNYVVDSDAEYTGDSNMIPYDQYVKDNAEQLYKIMYLLYQMMQDTLEIAKTTRKKINDKMKTPLWTEQNINIRPPDYSKENYLATFTPHIQLTAEHIFWSKDVLKIKAKALKEQTKTSKPIKALTVYPPNTPAMLVPRRITLTGLTKGERVFEQSKECYLIKVIPFFKTLKEYFEGIQKAITKEIKEMKEIFEELEAEVDQNAVDRKLFYIATNSELTLSRFSEMHDAHTVVQARCLELEAKLSKLKDKIQKDDHNEMVKRFSNLEVHHLNLQLKYQHLKESLRNTKSLPARDALDFDSVFETKKMKATIQGKDNTTKKVTKQINQLKETRSDADRTLDFKALYFQITQLIEKVTVLQEQNELFRAENARIKQHYKELYDSIKITHAKHIEQTSVLLTENEKLKAKINEK